MGFSVLPVVDYKIKVIVFAFEDNRGYDNSRFVESFGKSNVRIPLCRLNLMVLCIIKASITSVQYVGL